MIDIEQVANDVFVIAYTGRNDGFITTIKVSADGKTIATEKIEHDTANAAGSGSRWTATPLSVPQMEPMSKHLISLQMTRSLKSLK